MGFWGFGGYLDVWCYVISDILDYLYGEYGQVDSGLLFRRTQELRDMQLNLAGSFATFFCDIKNSYPEL